MYVLGVQTCCFYYKYWSCLQLKELRNMSGDGGKTDYQAEISKVGSLGWVGWGGVGSLLFAGAPMGI